MYFHDMKPYEYKLPFVLDSVVCIGWIDEKNPYNTLPQDFNKQLASVLENLLAFRSNQFDIRVNPIRGSHKCNICGDYIEFSNSSKIVPLGMSEIWIPNLSLGSFFASPSMIIHYIKMHSYSPPRIFFESVMNLNKSNYFIAQDIYDGLISDKMERGWCPRVVE